MRYGFTTGSCAAAASKAAAYMLLSGREKTEITIETPKGIDYHAAIEDITRTEQYVSCAVRKDGGDDPDVTTGALVYAKVSFPTEHQQEDCSVHKNLNIQIEGGVGVGRITRPGLDQPVGNAAINSVPRQMIQKEVTEVCQLLDYCGHIQIVISVPGGEKIAAATFNPRLGILGGISILGTSGIVEPMSSQALLDTIRVELSQRYAEGRSIAAVSPGNYGLDFMKKTYGYDLNQSVKCSNFIGQTIDMVSELGFTKMLLTGHIGKLIKVSGGIMNTHSKEGDCRMELLAAAAIWAGADTILLQKILHCISTEDATRILRECGLLESTMGYVMTKISDHLSHRAGTRLQVECIVYSSEIGLLGMTTGAEKILQELFETVTNDL